MYRKTLFISVWLILASSAKAQGIDGTWKLTYLTDGGTVEYTRDLVQLKTVDGKITGEVITPGVNNNKTSVGQKGDVLRIEMDNGVPIVFEAPVAKTPRKRWLGALRYLKKVYPAWLSPTTEVKLDFSTQRRTHICPPMQEAFALTDQVRDLSSSSMRNPLPKKVRLEKLAEAEKLANKETPRLYREVLSKFPEDPAVFEAILDLMRSAQANRTAVDEVKGWAAMADKAAKAYGPLFETGFATQAAAVLEGQVGYETLALDFARRVERALTPETPLAEQLEVLEPLGRALRAAAQDDEAKRVALRMAKIEDALDREYLASLPPVTEGFAGRKSKSDRVVILEQFTTNDSGIGAEKACSMLLKTYKPSELVLLQYYPKRVSNRPPLGTRDSVFADPLGNPDAQARWAYYTKAFPQEIGWMPTSIFNGYPKAVARDLDAKVTYQAFRSVIDPLLEENASVALAAKAHRNGDKIDIQINVSGLAKPGADKKLRIVLAEETVRYLSNSRSVRLHHHVVRACPGGVAGKPLTDAASKHVVSISIGEIRAQLTKHFEDNRKAFTSQLRPAPPVLLEDLRVVAFVQDDLTREILQAVQVEVK